MVLSAEEWLKQRSGYVSPSDVSSTMNGEGFVSAEEWLKKKKLSAPTPTPITSTTPQTSFSLQNLITKRDPSIVANALKDLFYGIVPGSRQTVKLISERLKKPKPSGLGLPSIRELASIPAAGLRDVASLVKTVATAAPRIPASAYLSVRDLLAGKPVQDKTSELLEKTVGAVSVPRMQAELRREGAGRVVQAGLPLAQTLMDLLMAKHIGRGIKTAREDMRLAKSYRTSTPLDLEKLRFLQDIQPKQKMLSAGRIKPPIELPSTFEELRGGARPKTAEVPTSQLAIDPNDLKGLVFRPTKKRVKTEKPVLFGKELEPAIKVEKIPDITGKEQNIVRITQKKGKQLFKDLGFEQQPNKNFWKKGDTYVHYNTIDKTWHIEGKLPDQLQTKSQLADFYNQAVRGVKPEVKPAVLKEFEPLAEGKQMVNKAIEKYGTTNVPESSSFITQKGKIIDSSGKKLGALTEGRNIDHREIAVYSLPSSAKTKGMGGTEGLNMFMDKTGSLRVNVTPDELAIEAMKPLTQEQFNQVKRLSQGRTIEADISEVGRTLKSGTFKNFNDYKEWISDFYNQAVKGVKTEKPVLFGKVSKEGLKPPKVLEEFAIERPYILEEKIEEGMSLGEIIRQRKRQGQSVKSIEDIVEPIEKSVSDYKNRQFASERLKVEKSLPQELKPSPVVDEVLEKTYREIRETRGGGGKTMPSIKQKNFLQTIYDDVFRNMTEKLDSLGEAGKELNRIYTNLKSYEGVIRGRESLHAKQMIPSLNPKEQWEFIRVMEEGAVSVNPKVLQAVNATRQFNRIHLKEANKLKILVEDMTGLPIGDPETYVPHRLNDQGLKVLRKNRMEFFRKMADHNKMTVENFMTLWQRFIDPKREIKATFEYKRNFRIPERWRETNPLTLNIGYIRDFAKRIATAEFFGKKYEKADLLASKIGVETMNPADAQFARNFIDMVVGRGTRDFEAENAWSKAIRWQVHTKLGPLTTLQNLNQGFLATTNYLGQRYAWYGLIKSLTREGIKNAQKTGVVGEGFYADFAKTNKAWQLVSGFPLSEDFNFSIVSNGARLFIQDMYKRLEKNPADTYAASRLDDLGVVGWRKNLVKGKPLNETQVQRGGFNASVKLIFPKIEGNIPEWATKSPIMRATYLFNHYQLQQPKLMFSIFRFGKLKGLAALATTLFYAGILGEVPADLNALIRKEERTENPVLRFAENAFTVTPPGWMYQYARTALKYGSFGLELMPLGGLAIGAPLEAGANIIKSLKKPEEIPSTILEEYIKGNIPVGREIPSGAFFHRLGKFLFSEQ